MFARKGRFLDRSDLSRASSIAVTICLVCLASFAQTDPTAAQTNQTATTDKLRSAAVTPERLSASFAEVAKAVEPAVVNIDTKGNVPDVSAKSAPGTADSDDIMDFFRRQLPRRPVYAVGSGFIVDRSGYILTNAHVIEDAARITVKLDSGEEYVARLVGSDDETDLAVLKIDAGKDLPFVRLGDSDAAQVGDWVLALGSPFGLSRTVTAGIVSQTRRETPQGSAFQRFIQTDAAINRGNSGGPLVNMNGEVIGINSQIATSTGDYNGVGFALPSNEAANVYAQIVKGGKVRRGYLGVQLESVKKEFAKVYGLDNIGGAIITQVRASDTPAGAAGLKVGDVIVAVNNAKVDGAVDLISKISSLTPGQAVSIEYYRENGAKVERKSATITVGERPATKSSDVNAKKIPLDPGKDEQKPFGLTLTELTPALATTYKLEDQKGLVVKDINPASYIADVKISSGADALDEGDLIQRINRVNVTDLKSFTQAVSKLKPGDAVVLEVITYDRAQRGLRMKVVQFTVQ
jgi:serine protease Do